jgi:hypothetical protein
MENNTSPRDRAVSPSPHQEIDYSPKEYSLRDHVPILLKYIVVAGLVFLAFWFFETR